MPKSKNKNLEQELKEIYRDEDGKMPDLRTILRAKEHRIRKILIALVIFFAALSATSWAGFFIFNKQFSGTGVSIEIEGPEKFVFGESTEVRIKYRNRDRNALASASIDVSIPKEFKLDEAVPATAKEGRWELGTLPKGASGEVILRGKSLGGVNAALLFEAIIAYRLANFSATFEKVSTKSFDVQEFALDGSLTGPDKILAGEDATYQFSFINTTENAIHNLKINVLFPVSLIVTKIPDDFSLEKTITISELQQSERKEFEFVGSFSAGIGGPQDIKFQLGLIDDDGVFRLGREVRFETNVLASDLELGILVNGAGTTTFARFDDTLNITINYKNKGTEDLNDVELILDIGSVPEEAGKKLLDITKREEDIRSKVIGNTLVWTKKEIRGLAKIAGGDEGNIDVRFKLINAPFTTSSRDYEVRLSMRANIGRIGEVEAKRTLQSTPSIVKLLSDTELVAEARYYTDDGIVLGQGPLPPRVGEITHYRILWKLHNTLHEIENIEVKTVLPDYVIYTRRSNVGAGDLRYNADTRTVIWTLNRMPLSVASLETNFEVSITPKEENRGKTVELISSSNMTARDKFHGGIITIALPESLTTALVGDEFGRSKGAVQ